MVNPQPRKRPVNDSDRDRLTKPITDGLAGLIFGSPGLFDDRPGFIAAPPSGNPFQDTVRAITQANCRIWAGRDKSNYSSAVNAGNSDLCKPYLESIGEFPGEAELGEPFEGGQCFGEIYVGTFSYVTGPEFDPVEQEAFFRFRGPIIGAFDNGGPSSPDGTGITAGPGGFRTGTPFACGAVGLPAAAPPQYRPFVNGGRNGRITSITACGLDNCGNAPPTIIPPPRIPPPIGTPAPIVVNPPGFGPVNVNVDLDPEGQPIICFEEIDTCVTVTPPGDGGGTGGGGDGNPNPTDPGSPGGGGDTGAGGAADGEGEDGQELVGVLVEILSAPEGANVFSNNAVDVFRGIGYVRMGFPGRLGVDTSASAVLGPQFFHAQQRGLTAWEVRANVGFNLRATPYYREATE